MDGNNISGITKFDTGDDLKDGEFKKPDFNKIIEEDEPEEGEFKKPVFRVEKEEEHEKLKFRPKNKYDNDGEPKKPPVPVHEDEVSVANSIDDNDFKNEKIPGLIKHFRSIIDPKDVAELKKTGKEYATAFGGDLNNLDEADFKKERATQNIIKKLGLKEYGPVAVLLIRSIINED